ncbi:uncharacterized protein ATNIH1004_008325 [Aspergillus tanneri]|uniref:Uncharacterized protein n=1 Tax=Aspergillus tanneri TaxID=1220188 RepID=A0A5M9MN28_9EURO|nr:uncharacterized protein ATNIH1004_008325 [Aspergillus tanneri]KAA8644127.1 hypothetical protein ATNIH1004_008325 [Aspergillus tanneri]
MANNLVLEGDVKDQCVRLLESAFGTDDPYLGHILTVLDRTDCLPLAIGDLTSSQGVWVAGEGVDQEQVKHDKAKLKIMGYLLEHSGGSLPFVNFCINRLRVSHHILHLSSWRQELATLVFSYGKREVLAEYVSPWVEICRHLFLSEPQAVMCALVGCSETPLPENVEILRDKIFHVLHLVQRYHFDLLREPIGAVLREGNILAEAEVEPDEAEAVQNFLSRLQQLQGLVSEPDDLVSLIQCEGYNSAKDIVDHKVQAVECMEANGIPSERVQAIVSHAQVLELRRDQLWREVLDKRGTGGIADVRLAAVDAASDDDGPPDERPPLADVINMTELFGLQSMGCIECASVTGPAAYFVDLLQKLGAIRLGTTGNETLRSKLFERRPDLADLELSCANTKVLIPYIDLVNEVLESVLWNAKQGRRPKIQAFNMGEHSSSEAYIAQPQNTNLKVYQEIVQPMIYPMHVFPYNQATHATRACLTALGISRIQLMRTLRAPRRISTCPEQKPDAEKILARSVAAESLGLQREDYVAITRESCYSLEYLLSQDQTWNEDSYCHSIGLKDIHEYWGYTSQEEMCGESGLTLIKRELLPRSGLDFQGLLSILKTRFMGKRLVILSKNGGVVFTDSLDNMRLRQLPRKGDQETLSLDPDICHELQAFLRLKEKLQWPLDELDSLLVTLSGTRTSSIDPQLMDELAAVQELSELTGINRAELQPLWGGIDVEDQNLLYSRLFYNLHGFQAGSMQVPGNLPLILSGLQLSVSEYEAVMSASQLTSPLGHDGIRQLYRVAILCRMLGISPFLYGEVLSVYPDDTDPFHGPRETLALIKKWKEITSIPGSWAPEQLLFILRGESRVPDSSTNQPAVDKNLQIAASIVSSTATSTVKFDSVTAIIETDLRNRVSQLASMIFGEEQGKEIVHFIDKGGTPDDKARITALIRFVFGENAPGVIESIEQEQNSTAQMRVFYSQLAAAVSTAQRSQVILASLQPHFPGLDITTLQFCLTEIIHVREKRLDGKSSALCGMDTLLGLSRLPTAQDSEFQGYFRLPKTGRYNIDLAPAHEPEGEKARRLVLDGTPLVLHGNGPQRAETSRLLAAHWYKLEYTGPFSDLDWSSQETVPPTHVSFTGNNLIRQETLETTSSVVAKLTQLSEVISHLDLKISEVRVLQAKGIYLNSLTLANLIQLVKYRLLREEFQRAGAKERLLELYRWLSAQDPETSLASKIQSTTGWTIQECTDYLHGRYPGMKDANLLQVFGDINELFEMREVMRFVRRGGLSNVPLQTLFEMATPVKPELPSEQRPGSVTAEFNNAAILRSAIQSRHSSGSGAVGSTSLSTANDQIRKSQRTALIHCLLVQSKLSADQPPLRDANDLFGHYLIDVQMGTELHTSRIKQAISTVQLFLQRCMLGSEKKQGIRSTLLRENLSDWEIENMMRYRLWEANRKSYLYPENWIDPTLRDDKTEQFQTVEGTVMQSKLDDQRIADIIKGYVHSATEVADIEIVSYLWERKDTGEIPGESEFHFFGRSRTIPPAHYYRKLHVRVNTGSSLNQLPRWKREILSQWDKGNRGKFVNFWWSSVHRMRLREKLWYLENLLGDIVLWPSWERLGVVTELRKRLCRMEPQQHEAEGLIALMKELGVERSRPPSNTDDVASLLAKVLGEPTEARKQIPRLAKVIGELGGNQSSIRIRDYLVFHLGLSIAKGSLSATATEWSPWTKLSADIPMYEHDYDMTKLDAPGTYLIPAISNGRLLVFIPDIITGQQSALGQAEGGINDSKYGELTDKKVVGSLPHQHWEIRLGYIEYINGKWSAKKLSQSSIRIQQNKDQKLQSITSFLFRVGKKASRITEDQPKARETLSVTVESLTSGGGGGHIWGKFEVRGHQLILTDHSTTIPTPSLRKTASEIPIAVQYGPRVEFCRIKFNEKPTSGALKRAGVSGAGQSPDTMEPLFAEARGSVRSWLMSFPSNSLPQGLVMEAAGSHAIETYFSFPVNPRARHDQQDWITERLTDFATPLLMQNVNSDQSPKDVYRALRDLPSNLQDEAFGRRHSVVFHERATPSAVYHWELGVHIPSLLMERLIATQQYELALKVARLVFDPTTDGERVDRCWSFPPFRDEYTRTGIMPDFTRTWETTIATEEWRASKGNVHAAARYKPRAYMMRFVIKYIQALVALGDQYFRQETMESIPLAIQRYSEADHLFGPRPVENPRLGKYPVMTYNDIQSELDPSSNVNVDLGLDFPFFSEPGARGKAGLRHGNSERFALIRTLYFCIPSNPELVSLRDLIDSRLYNIRNGMDINGNVRTLPLFEPALDPGMVVRSNAAAAGPGTSSLLGGLENPMPRYRFRVLMQHGHDLVNELRDSAQQLLSIKEKKDGEALAILRSKHQNAVLQLIIKVKERQKVESEKAVAVLHESRRQQEARLQYYLELIGQSISTVQNQKTGPATEGYEIKPIPRRGQPWIDIPQAFINPSSDDLRMSPFEKAELDLYEQASGKNQKAAQQDYQAAVVSVIPAVTVNVQPMGVGLSTSFGSNTIGQFFASQASMYRQEGQQFADNASRAARMAAATRLLQERRHEANTIGRELMRIDKDLAQMEARLATCDAEIQTQQQEIENAAAEEEWLNRKYTNKQLYAVLDNSLSAMFHQTYLLAIEMMKIAWKALNFEHAVPSQNGSLSALQMPSNASGYCEKSVDGLLSSKALFLELKQMEMRYLEDHTHDYEIVKNISLRQLNPESLLKLQADGNTEFKLSEALFDLDFPRHYCRRISSVALSIPCIVGPYASLNCTLSLQHHEYRVSSQHSDSIRTDPVPITSIAVSSGVEDSGVFDLNFRSSDRYGPFEGAGAISSWSLQLPKHRQFDYSTISDVVLHLRYTALDGSSVRETNASRTIDEFFAATHTLAINLSSEYAAQWQQMWTSGVMELPSLIPRLPYWTRDKTVTPSKVSLLTALGDNVSFQLKAKGSQSHTILQTAGKQYGYNLFTASDSLPGIQELWNIVLKGLGSPKQGRGWLLVGYGVK